MKRLELAVVGCGEIAGYAALVSKLIPQIRLAACCDVNADRAQAFARRHGIRQVFTDYADLLAQGSFQALYLAVPHDLHSPMILQAVGAGIPVLTEKPLARSLLEGVQIVEMAAQRGVKVGVNYMGGCHAVQFLADPWQPLFHGVCLRGGGRNRNGRDSRHDLRHFPRYS